MHIHIFFLNRKKKKKNSHILKVCFRYIIRQQAKDNNSQVIYAKWYFS